MAASSGFDHVIIGVDDLEDAADLWRRLGFTVTPRGRHIGWGTANYCVMFDHDYVELLGILEPDQYLYGLDRFLADNGEGLLSVAFGTADPSETYRALQTIGQQGDPPKDLARLLELPEGTVTPRFHLVHPREAKAFGVGAFFCQHLTPELVRRPAWLSHPNGATGLVGIDLRVSDPTKLASRYRTMFGADAVTADGDGFRVQAGRTRMTLRPGNDTVDGMTFGVNDLVVIERCLDRAGHPIRATTDQNSVSLANPINGISMRFTTQ